MKLHPRLSRAAVELVKRFETFHETATPTSDGGWSIGYGHTLTAREGAAVDAADAEALLLYDLNAAAEAVARGLYAPVSQTEFDALTAFAFNVGADNFARSSALARVNAGAALDAADEIERWRHAELGAGAQVVDALVRRRAAEKAHFLSLPEGMSKSPTPGLRPRTDTAPLASPASATLSAANGIQARLRELVPDGPPSTEPSRTQAALTRLAQLRQPPPRAEAPLPDAPHLDAPEDTILTPFEPDEAPPPIDLEPHAGEAAHIQPQSAPLQTPDFEIARHHHPVDRETPEDLSLAEADVASPATPDPAPLQEVDAEPPPPPFANDHDRIIPAFDPLADEADAASEPHRASDADVQGGAAPPIVAADFDAPEQTPEAGAATRRRVMLAIGLIGLLVFAAAAAAIFMGKANLASLVTGLVGVLGMTVGLHSLLTSPAPTDF